ncbi:MAG: hypothetical protein IID61_17880, partial [SAR324 cluster bacterium]|nr:hypothetical protein [SAR324 cluster bacterium]
MEEQTYHQRGEVMVAQGVLPFQYEDEEGVKGMTALAGLPIYLDLFQAMGLTRRNSDSIPKGLPSVD